VHSPQTVPYTRPVYPVRPPFWQLKEVQIPCTGIVTLHCVLYIGTILIILFSSDADNPFCAELSYADPQWYGYTMQLCFPAQTILPIYASTFGAAPTTVTTTSPPSPTSVTPPSSTSPTSISTSLVPGTPTPTPTHSPKPKLPVGAIVGGVVGGICKYT
jgi:hypothetical protein